MKTFHSAVISGALLGAVLAAGCGKDRAKEFFDEQERAETESGAGQQDQPGGPEVDLKSLVEPKAKPDDGVPPPLLVDVRELRETFEDGTIRVARSVKFFSDGSAVNHGPFTEWHPNGKKFFEGRYEDGKKAGEWTYYLDDGSKAKSGTYKNGLQDGVWTVWQAGGKPEQPIRQEEYKQGLRHGAWIYWTAAGQKTREEHYAKGELDGQVSEWYPSGQLKAQAQFKQGKRDGKTINWNEQGQKTAEMVFRDNVLVDQISSSGQK